MRRGVFLQVRLASTRLPRKALRTIGGLTILEWCLRSLGSVAAEVHAVLTDDASVEDLGPIVRREGWQLFVGHPEDVLDRFVRAARHFQTDLVLRATGDNPFVSVALAERNLLHLAEEGWDLYAAVHAPLGVGTEAVRLDALELALQSAPDTYEREHVTPYLYHHPERFRVGRPTVGPDLYLPEGRVTVDTPADYDRVAVLVEQTGWRPPVDTAALVRVLREGAG